MNLRRKRVIFGLSLLAGFLWVMGQAGYEYWQRQPRAHMSQLTPEVTLSSQIQVAWVPELAARGYATIVDLRPDGEGPDQPSSKEMEAAARAAQIQFFYVPVPHGEVVPADAVAALGKIMATSPKPMLLYCRSGRRAVRTWSLAEAARPGGLDAEAIKAAAKGAGLYVDDLTPAIYGRVASRKKQQGTGQ